MEVGGKTLPVSISGFGPAGKLKSSFLNFLRKIKLDFQFYFWAKTDRSKDKNSHVAEPNYRVVSKSISGHSFDFFQNFFSGIDRSEHSAQKSVSVALAR